MTPPTTDALIKNAFYSYIEDTMPEPMDYIGGRTHKPKLK